MHFHSKLLAKRLFWVTKRIFILTDTSESWIFWFRTWKSLMIFVKIGCIFIELQSDVPFGPAGSWADFYHNEDGKAVTVNVSGIKICYWSYFGTNFEVRTSLHCGSNRTLPHVIHRFYLLLRFNPLWVFMGMSDQL